MQNAKYTKTHTHACSTTHANIETRTASGRQAQLDGFTVDAARYERHMKTVWPIRLCRCIRCDCCGTAWVFVCVETRQLHKWIIIVCIEHPKLCLFFGFDFRERLRSHSAVAGKCRTLPISHTSHCAIESTNYNLHATYANKGRARVCLLHNIWQVHGGCHIWMGKIGELVDCVNNRRAKWIAGNA